MNDTLFRTSLYLDNAPARNMPQGHLKLERQARSLFRSKRWGGMVSTSVVKREIHTGKVITFFENKDGNGNLYQAICETKMGQNGSSDKTKIARNAKSIK